MDIDISNARLFSSLQQAPKIVEKIWGTESIITGSGYTTKVMSLKPGWSSSLHFHVKKNETFFLLQGELEIEMYSPEGDRTDLTLENPLDTLVLPAPTPHRFYVPEGQPYPTIFIEASTLDDPEDNFRIEKSHKL